MPGNADRKQAEVTALRDRLMFIIDFIERAEDFPSGGQLKQIISDAANKQNLKSLRLIGREVDKITLALATPTREGLEAVLTTRFGIDKEVDREEQRSEVARIISRGRINSEKERQRLVDYVAVLQATGAENSEVERIVKLLNS